MENTMAAAERMRAMRERRQARGLRELRLVVPDARSKAIRRRVAKEVAGLDRAGELAALGGLKRYRNLTANEARRCGYGCGVGRLWQAAAGGDRADGCLPG